MVTVRKSSIPMPNTLPPPPPEPNFQQHNVDTSDLPPIPAQRQQPYVTNQYEEMGNPWEDANEYSRPAEKKHDIPDLLRPGPSKAAQSVNNSTIPDVLRPGWSGEATPRSSLDSDRDRSPQREWWDDEPEEDRGKQNEPDGSGRLPTELHVVNDTPSPAVVQPASKVKRKPVAQSLTPQKEPSPSSSIDRSAELSSNNPFRRPSDTSQNMENSSPVAEKTREQHPHPLRSSPSIDRLGRLALSDPSSEKEAWSEAEAPPISAPPPPPATNPPPIPRLQEPLQPQQTGTNPWASQPVTIPKPAPSPSSFEPSKQYNTIPTDDLLDRGQHEGPVSLQNELRAIPNNVTAPAPSSEVSLLEDDAPAPAKPPRPVRRESDDLYAPPAGPPPLHQAQLPPVKPPRPAVVTSEADLAKLRQQRNETYQIKHFNWHDIRTSRMRRSSMLTQNKNGPCPLLALVNALILGATEDMQASLDEALRLREQVTLGLIIETLMDELITRASAISGLKLPEIDELNRFLMRLRTGMNANPRFVAPSQPAPNLMDADTPTTPTVHQQQTSAGTFERTEDITLYGSFQVKLVHGWLPQPGDQAEKAFARTAQTYEDAQAVQFGEEELEYKLSSSGLTEQEQQVWEDIRSIKHFFQTYPTQLTEYGLSTVQRTLEGGEFAIMFRNDHFSTIYKHPRDQRLYTLITDAGYADRDEIIWESLEDIKGARSDFFSGDFNSVSHGDTAHSIPHSMTDAANPQRRRAENLAPPQEQQEQADMDFALALQMQEEEEQAQRQARSQQQQAQRGDRPDTRGGRPDNSGRSTGRRTSQGIPIPLRSNPGGEQRPSIPPRNRNQGVNRPTDANAADAPPAYEEAARQTAYVPPIGSPLHPSSSTDLPLGRASTSTSNVHAQGQTTGVTGGNSPYGRPQASHRRRTSAYGENSEQWEQDHSASVYAPAYAFMSPNGESSSARRRAMDGSRREREGDERCNVM